MSLGTPENNKNIHCSKIMSKFHVFINDFIGAFSLSVVLLHFLLGNTYTSLNSIPLTSALVNSTSSQSQSHIQHLTGNGTSK